MSDPLRLVWERVDLDPPLLASNEVVGEHAAGMQLLTELGVVRETDAASTAPCDACGDSHVEDVVLIESPPGSGVRAYITCPDNGRVAVPLDHLRRFRLDLCALAGTIAEGLGSNAISEEIIPSRLWLLGQAAFGGRMREVFLARGLTWPDTRHTVTGSPRLTAALRPVVLVASTLPASTVWPGDPPPVIPLDAITSLTPSGLAINRGNLDDRVSGIAARTMPLRKEERQSRVRDPQAVFDEVDISFATEPGARHVVRINGIDFEGFRRSDLKFLRLLLLAAARAADADGEQGGWLHKSRLGGDEKDHDVELLRAELADHPHEDLDEAERRALIKRSGERDGRIRLAVAPHHVHFDDSLARFQLIAEEQTMPRGRGQRPTPGQRKRAENFARSRTVVARLLREARELGVPGPR